MTMRKKLSLSVPSDGDAAAGNAENNDKTASWNVSEARKDKLHDRARFNRRHPSEAHKRLWDVLKDKGVGNFAFNREVVMGSSLVDFACKARWLVVEISGTSEADAKIESLSDRKLKEVGVRIMRFTQEEVMGDLEPIQDAILNELRQPFEKPSRGGFGHRASSAPQSSSLGDDREFNRRGSIR